MRSAIIAALVGVVAAVPLTETIYNTQVLTITSCGPEVTDCPGKKTSAPVATTSCTEGHKESYTAPPVYWSTSVVPVVSTSSVPAPPPYVKSSEAPKPSTSEAVKSSSAPAVPSSSVVVVKSSSAPAVPSSSWAAVTSSVPAPPPYKETSTPVAVPSSKVTSKPAVGTSVKPSGTASTGVVPYKTTSPVWSATASSPAKYTGAASHLNAAGALVGAGAIAALFL